MNEMCLNCYGTGVVTCQVCGGTGVMPNVSLLDEDCLKCKGFRRERCMLCLGTGFVSEEESLQPTETAPQAHIDLITE